MEFPFPLGFPFPCTSLVQTGVRYDSMNADPVAMPVDGRGGGVPPVHPSRGYATAL